MLIRLLVILLAGQLNPCYLHHYSVWGTQSLCALENEYAGLHNINTNGNGPYSAGKAVNAHIYMRHTYRFMHIKYTKWALRLRIAENLLLKCVLGVGINAHYMGFYNLILAYREPMSGWIFEPLLIMSYPLMGNKLGSSVKVWKGIKVL